MGKGPTKHKRDKQAAQRVTLRAVAEWHGVIVRHVEGSQSAEKRRAGGKLFLALATQKRGYGRVMLYALEYGHTLAAAEAALFTIPHTELDTIEVAGVEAAVMHRLQGGVVSLPSGDIPLPKRNRELNKVLKEQAENAQQVLDRILGR